MWGGTERDHGEGLLPPRLGVKWKRGLNKGAVGRQAIGLSHLYPTVLPGGSGVAYVVFTFSLRQHPKPGCSRKNGRPQVTLLSTMGRSGVGTWGSRELAQPLDQSSGSQKLSFERGKVGGVRRPGMSGGEGPCSWGGWVL